MRKNIFISGNTYVDSGRYKSNPNDEFGLSFYSGTKTITNQGGIRRRFFETDICEDLNLPIKIPAVLVLVTTLDNVYLDVEKPWMDELKKPKLIYHGDNKPLKNGLSKALSERDGCKDLIAIDQINSMSSNLSNFVPPILYFTKRQSGFMTFEGLFALDSINKYLIHGDCENIRANLLCIGDQVNMKKLRERPLVGNRHDLPEIHDYVITN